MDMDKDTVASATYGLCAIFTVAAAENTFGHGVGFAAAGVLGVFAKDILGSLGYKDKTVPFLAGLFLGMVILYGVQSSTQNVDEPPQREPSATQEQQIAPPSP